MSRSLKAKLIETSRKLGFEKIGFASAAPSIRTADRLDEWIQGGKHATMLWMEKRQEDRSNILSYFPEAKTVISFAMNYYHGNADSILHGEVKFSIYAWGDDYHDLLKKRIRSLASIIKSAHPEAKTIVCTDTSPVMEKYWAQKAGIGWQGKHTNLITRDYGSWLFLGEIITDVLLKPDEPFMEDLCGTCTACLDACPTQALEPYVLDSNKCISYLTIEHRGEFNQHTWTDGWIYGCDVCQDVCPWNIKFSRPSVEPAFKPRPDIVSKSKDDWLNLTREEFTELFRKSPVKRTKYEGLIRNIEHTESSRKK